MPVRQASYYISLVIQSSGGFLIKWLEHTCMAYTHVNYHDVETDNEAMHFLRDPLDCDQLGATVIECEPGWTGMEHDHGDEGHEEVYLLLEGNATVTVAGDDISMGPGDALRIAPDATRQIQNGDTESTFVLAGAP
jgi:quercetin dioxygenase-like cupin family protein